MALSDKIDVTTQDTGFGRRLGNEVIRHQKEFLAVQPLVGGTEVLQFSLAARSWILAEQQIQDGHEVALTGPERPVEVRRLAFPTVHSTFDEFQGLHKAGAKLFRDHVGVQNLVGGPGIGGDLGKIQNEVPSMNCLRQIEQFAQGGLFDYGHGTTPPARRFLRQNRRSSYLSRQLLDSWSTLRWRGSFAFLGFGSGPTALFGFGLLHCG